MSYTYKSSECSNFCLSFEICSSIFIDLLRQLRTLENLGILTREFTLLIPSRAVQSSLFAPPKTPACEVSLHLAVLKLPENDKSGDFVGWFPPLDEEWVERHGCLRKRQMAAQSSIFDVGYLVLHVLTALCTKSLAASARFLAEDTVLTTCLFDSTSHSWKKCNNRN